MSDTDDDSMEIEYLIGLEDGLGLEDGKEAHVQLRRRRYLEKIEEVMGSMPAPPDPDVCIDIVQNIRQVLPNISRNEHLSGLFQAIVACCAGGNVSTNALAKTLDVDKKTARKAMKKRHKYEENQPHSHMLIQPSLTKDKIETATINLVQQFISEHLTPSSSTKNVVKKKSKGKVEMKAKHWRTISIESMYDKYVDNHPENWISFTSFYHQIPWYVHAKPQRSGLCVYHDRAYKVMKLVKNMRSQWHLRNCNCKCQFCSKDGCNHGQGSTDCLEGLCNRCSSVCCPLEKTTEEHRYTLVEYIYDTTERGNKKLRQTTNSYVKSRKQIMALWKEEMAKFRDHSTHVKYHKEQMKTLFELQKKKSKMVIARWDFAENYVHESGSMVSTEHYGKEQSQLLIVSYWHHSEQSTLEKPDIKLKYMAFTSDYLSHNTVFFKKCLEIFVNKIKSELLTHGVNRIHLLTDGSQQHFKNKRAYNNVSLLSNVQGNECIFNSPKIIIREVEN
jgi:hypothetical protein